MTLNNIVSKEDCRVPEISVYTYNLKRVINVDTYNGSCLLPQQ